MSDAEHIYADIIDLPHHVSSKYPHMSMEQRAAQFSPFAALAGHTEAIKQAGGITPKNMGLMRR